MIRRLLVGVVVAAMLAASCGGGDDIADTASDSTAASTATSVDGQRVDTTPPEPTESAAPESTVPPETAPAGPILAVPDAEVITQTTATSGGGTRPLLTWEPVDGAAEYLVVVFTDDAAPYWSTITDQPETHVGGAVAIPAGVDGPEVADGYSWAVYADDETGTPIASSPIRPISP